MALGAPRSKKLNLVRHRENVIFVSSPKVRDELSRLSKFQENLRKAIAFFLLGLGQKLKEFCVSILVSEVPTVVSVKRCGKEFRSTRKSILFSLLNL
ncbi:hypothetical protein KR51_00004720 [Rubidibacter lacunae KORDI 51-2]|uniref:Uncharacterized protein n=1 Tax=Rubidibacter lacunae KORDI 51-2 TaxID=582515 RepID=U5DEB1_9CHRO|nr:hypothetical protein KR51_00004720 [Rubidibacter lacunae KORDI 51-2]